MLASFACWRDEVSNKNVGDDPPRLPALSFRGELLIRPLAYADEHQLGYKLRLAHLNGLDNPRWLDASTDGAAMPKGHGRARWCPHCLAESEPFWRKTWEQGHAACFIHRCWLVDVCPSCSREAIWTRLRLLSCRCGQELAGVISPAFSRELIAVLNPCPGADASVAGWDKLNPDERWRTALFLGALQAYGLRGKPLKKASSTSVDTERQLVNTGASIFAGGPEARFALLDRIRVKPPMGDAVQTMSEAFPRLAVLMRKQLGKKERYWLEAEVNAYVSSTVNSKAAVVWKQRKRSRPGSAQSCARRFGVRPTRISSMCSDIGVKPKARCTRSGRRVLVISAEELELVEHGLSNTASARATARRFELSPQRLRVLVTAGLICGRGTGVDSDSISRLLRRLVTGMIPEGMPLDADLIPVSEAFRFLVPVSRTVPFVEMLLRKEIAVLSSQKDKLRFRDIYVSKRQVVNMAGINLSRDSRLTICEAAGKLEIKQEVMYHLVNIGLLKTITDRSGRRATRVISQSELERFSAEFEPLTRAAARAGVGFRSGLAWAKRQGLVLASGPSVDGGRQYFVRRHTS